MTWLETASRLQRDGHAFALITVVGVRGHAPRGLGSRMVVTADSGYGSVGGGNLEKTAVERAQEMLRVGVQAPERMILPLTTKAETSWGKQCCGGEVELLIEPVYPERTCIAVVGVGHVGLALGRVLQTLPIELRLIDTRPEMLAAERLRVLTDDAAAARVHPHKVSWPEKAIAALPTGTHVVIMTHDHAEDLAAVEACLRRPDLGYIGMIGSRTKWARLKQALQQDHGYGPEDLVRVTSPIGNPQAGGRARKTPQVIAISTAAQLLEYMDFPADDITIGSSGTEFHHHEAHTRE